MAYVINKTVKKCLIMNNNLLLALYKYIAILLVVIGQ